MSNYEELDWKPKSIIKEDDDCLWEAAEWGEDNYNATHKIHGCKAILTKLRLGKSVAEFLWFCDLIKTEYKER